MSAPVKLSVTMVRPGDGIVLSVGTLRVRKITHTEKLIRFRGEIVGAGINMELSLKPLYNEAVDQFDVIQREDMP